MLLLHGWPDDVRTYDRMVPVLQAAGFRTIAPYLRGFGDTSFLSKDTMRSGEIGRSCPKADMTLSGNAAHHDVRHGNFGRNSTPSAAVSFFAAPSAGNSPAASSTG
jgi:pimeloyl-ACP methyl ester carboxylesterase